MVFVVETTIGKVHNPLRLPCETTSERPKVARPSVFNTFDFEMCFCATTACTFWTSQLPKMLWTWCVLYIFDLEMCFVPQRRALFRHLNFQKRSDSSVFNTFDFQMCYAPQRRALFRHLNFQKWSGAEVFCTFWLANVLRARTVCNFSSLIWPHSSAPAALASLLVDPPEPQIIGKTQCFATLLPFRASASSFFSLFLCSDLLSSALLFSHSSHLCFSIFPYCRKFDF